MYKKLDIYRSAFFLSKLSILSLLSIVLVVCWMSILLVVCWMTIHGYLFTFLLFYALMGCYVGWVTIYNLGNFIAIKHFSGRPPLVSNITQKERERGDNVLNITLVPKVFY